jgi:cytochrome c553
VVIDAKTAASLVIYKDVVAPILEQKCVSCHGTEKSKGKLKMHTFADLMKGGSEGDVNVVAGKANDSLMMKRVGLPVDDDEHMPPEDKDQLSKEEIALLTWWINEGASETQTLDKAKRNAEIDGALAIVLKDKIKPAAVVAAKPAPAPVPAKPVAPAPAPKAAAAKPAAGPAPAKISPEAAAKAVVYSDVIAPILAEKCYSCHGEEKSKGKLRMHTFADLKKGGSEGDVNIVPGKSGDSLMVQRVLLPADDDEHMPPEDEPQVTKEELALLKWWIDNGASETETVAAAKKTPEIEGLLAVALTRLGDKPVGMVKKEEKPKAKPLTDDQKKQVAEITAKLQALNATLMPLAQDTEQLRLSVINAADKFGDKELALLEPIASQLVWLDLARSQVTDAGLASVAKMPYLERLHLENTKVTDAGLAKLAGLQALEYLNLYGTKVTDRGIAQLGGSKGLKKLFVWQTGVTKAGAKALEGKVAGLSVNVGLSEAEIAKLTAPPPAPPKVEEKKPAATKPAAKPEVKPAPDATKPAPGPAKKPGAAKPVPAPGAKPKEAKPATPPAAKPKPSVEAAPPAPAEQKGAAKGD